MAGQVYAQLSGPQGSIGLGLSATENVVGELVDETVSKSLGKTFAGRTINAFSGSVVAGHGGGVVMVRNSQGSGYKMIEFLPCATGERVVYLDRPFAVQEDDVAETMIEAVPT